MTATSCNEEDVRCITIHYKTADQFVSLIHLHKAFCRMYIAVMAFCPETPVITKFDFFSQNRISTLILKFNFILKMINNISLFLTNALIVLCII